MTGRCKKLQCFLAAMAAQCVALSAAWAADPQNPAEVRTRQVETGPAAAAANATPEVGAEVVYAFFPDVAYTVTVSRVEQIAPGTTAIQSVANDGRDITCLSIQSPDGLRLTVRDLGRRRLYQCVSLSGGKWEYREYDLSKELPRTPHPPIKPPEEEDKTEATAPFDPARGGVSDAESLATTYLDIMFVFDTTAQTWAASNGGVAAFAADAVARMNVAMQTTGIDCTFRLAATVNKSYTYGGEGLATPLYAIRNNEGVFSDVETLRTTYGADLVTLMVDTGSAYGNTGIGFVLSSSSGHASYAYTTCSIRAVNQGHTHTHEIGHNLGCGHATNQASSPGPALFSYSSGYYFTASGNDYHTIMAYNSDGYGGFYDECDYFSTPLKTFGTSGVVVGNSSTADNARTIRETMSVVSAYRDSTVSTPPAAPTGVNATDGSSTANVGVSWSASSGATSYSVWRGTSSSSASATSIASGLTSTSYNDTSATPGALYYYWVKASNTAGTSGFSSSNTGYRSLSAPGGVSATDGTSTTQVTVTWNAVTGASHYRVYRATSAGGTKTALGSWQTARSYADASATAGTTYYYFVVAAVDASGTRPSTYSSYNTGYRAVVAIPAPPTGVNAADGSSTANVAVTWTASSGAASYSVWRGTSSSSASAASIASGLTSTSHNDTSATPGVRFYYWVKATNAAGTSGFSSSDTGYRKLAAPTVSATTTDPTKVRVSWSAPAGASFYRVSRATTSTGAKTVVSDGWQGAQSFDDATAAVGTTFYYFVEAAVDSAGARPSAYSAYATGSRPLPPNNAFASATAISGPTGSVNGPTEGATKEAGEPEHNDEATAVNSVWWAWTAPYSGMATFDTVGSAFDTVLAVYTGTSVGALTAVASNDDAVGLASRVSFNATGGTVYRIAVAGYGGASGRAVLNWSLVSPIEPTIKSAGITTISGTMYCQVSFKAKAGRSYTVQRTDSLTSPSWTTVSTVSATADGLKSVSIAIPSNKPAGYYRVRTTE